MPVTNRGAFRMLQTFFRNTSNPTVMYAALIDASSTAPSTTTNTFADLTEVPAGNGYTAGGISLSRNSTDWDVLTEDDGNNRALIQARDLVWTASGGSLPSSGSGARYLALTDDNATQSARDIVGTWDLASNRVVSSGQTLTIQNAEIRLTTV